MTMTLLLNFRSNKPGGPLGVAYNDTMCNYKWSVGLIKVSTCIISILVIAASV